MIATPAKSPARRGNAAPAWQALRDEAMTCTRCPLYQDTTQTVFGEGQVDAPRMFIGEQPGDQEDLAGRALPGKAVTIGRLRGAPLALENGAQGWITIHPSYLLRLPDEARNAGERARFVRELREIGEQVKTLA